MAVPVLIQKYVKLYFCNDSLLKISFLSYFVGGQKALLSWVTDIKKQALPIEVLFKVIFNHFISMTVAVLIQENV